MINSGVDGFFTSDLDDNLRLYSIRKQPPMNKNEEITVIVVGMSMCF